MSEDDRRALADQQARLVDALTAAAAPPEGFDSAQIVLTARTLHQKRARAVFKCWPAIADGLAGRFGALFEEYAASHSLPPTGPVEDGFGFATWLLCQRLLDDAGRMQWLLHRAAYGWPIRMMRLSTSRRLAIAVRLPIFGVRHILIRFPMSRV
jgi:hypothetical protein